jgi:predicted metalloprotease
MRWRQGRRSENVEDRRGQRLSTGARVGGVGGLGLLVVVVAAMLLGVDPTEILRNVQTSSLPSSASVDTGPTGSRPDDELADFSSVVLADTEEVWGSLFEGMGRRYDPPVLVLFTDEVQSACGFASSATGPFYCPADGKLYLDLAFVNELQSRFGAPGDFALAYVIAHEVGHHVQNLLGISGQVQEQQQRLSETAANRLSVALELQADCLSGVWANHAQRARAVLEPGDLEEALNAASAVGDDRIQRQARGRVVPDSFTHGSSAQRVSWFRRGFETGDPGACDTFK